MRHCFIVLISVLFYSNANGQPVSVNESGLMHAQKIFDFSGKSSSEIYKQSKMWLNNYYKNPEAVLTGDIEDAAIKGRGHQSCGAVMKGLITTCFDLGYRFAIDIKDGKARMTINDFEVSTDQGAYSAETYCLKNNGEFRTNAQARAIVPGFESICEGLFSSFEDMFATAAADDW